MNDEGRYIQIMKDYESFLGVKLVNQQVEQLRQAREQQQNIDAQVSRDESSGYRTSTNGFASTGLDRNSTASRGVSQKNTNNLYVTQGPGVNDEERSERIIGLEGSAMESMSSMAESVGVRKSQKKLALSVMEQVTEQDGEDEIIDHNNDNEADNNVDQKDEVVNKNQFNLSKLNLKENRKHDKKLTQKEVDDIQNAKTKD